MTLGVDEKINGVNLGNWLVLEKWMKPALFEECGEDDEIWMHRTMEPSRLEELLRRHRETYVTERDFIAIASHGYNLVRIPVPYFVFGDVEGHPGCIEYVDRALLGPIGADCRCCLTCTPCRARKTVTTTAESQAYAHGARTRRPWNMR